MTESNEEYEGVGKDNTYKSPFKSQFFDFEQTGYQNETDFDLSKEYLRSELSDKTQIFNRISQQSFLKVIQLFYKHQFRQSFINWRKKNSSLKKIQQKNPKNMTKLFLKIFYTLDKKQRSRLSWSIVKISNFTKNYQMKNYEPPITKGLNALNSSFNTLNIKYFQSQNIREAFFRLVNLQKINYRLQIFQKGLNNLEKWQQFFSFQKFKKKLQEFKDCQSKIEILCGTLSLLIYPILRNFMRNFLLLYQSSSKFKKKSIQKYEENSFERILQDDFAEDVQFKKENQIIKKFQTQSNINVDSSQKEEKTKKSQNIYCDKNKQKKHFLQKKRFQSQDSNSQDQNIEEKNLNAKIFYQKNQKCEEIQEQINAKTLKYARDFNKISITSPKYKQADQDKLKLKFKFKKVSDKKKTFKQTQKNIKFTDTSILNSINKNSMSSLHTQVDIIKPASMINLTNLKCQKIKLKKDESINQQFKSFFINQKMVLLRQAKKDEFKDQICELTDNGVSFYIKPSQPQIILSKSKSKQKLNTIKSFNKIQNIHNIKKQSVIETALSSQKNNNQGSNNQYCNNYQLPKPGKIVFQNTYASKHLSPFNLERQNPVVQNANFTDKYKYKDEYFGGLKTPFESNGPSQINQYFFPISSQLLRSKSSSQSKLYSTRSEAKIQIMKNPFENVAKQQFWQSSPKKQINFQMQRDVGSLYIKDIQNQDIKKNQKYMKSQQLAFKTKRPRKQIARSSQKMKLVSNYYISGQKEVYNTKPISEYYQPSPNSQIFIQKNPSMQSYSQKFISYEVQNSPDLKEFKKPGQFSIVKSSRK